MCQECKVHPEDTLHTLWFCPSLKDTWKVQFSKLMTKKGNNSSFFKILEHASAEKSPFNLFAMMISEVWQRRNKVQVEKNSGAATDEQGLVMAALSQQIPTPASVDMVEVLVARRTLVFAKELGFDKEIVEGDSKNVITAINDEHMDYSSLGHVLQDIKCMFSSFSFISIKHIHGEGNCVAHKLARKAARCPFLVWMESVPPDFLDV
ncbi:hypothetical protein SO802_002171 [Lithocarpus litseifolius]|uniref:RNase H type-1 domain-containing protein n=1 Tax=Lithocarpus litseifolius TaxID=425828 RepID=A0AAW2DX10_9ROSI